MRFIKGRAGLEDSPASGNPSKLCCNKSTQSWRRRKCWWDFSFLPPLCPELLELSARIEHVLHSPQFEKLFSTYRLWEVLYSFTWHKTFTAVNKMMLVQWNTRFFWYCCTVAADITDHWCYSMYDKKKSFTAWDGLVNNNEASGLKRWDNLCLPLL